MAGPRLLERLDAKAGVQGVRQTAGQHIPARPIQDRYQVYQVKKAAPYSDVGMSRACETTVGQRRLGAYALLINMKKQTTCRRMRWRDVGVGDRQGFVRNKRSL